MKVLMVSRTYTHPHDMGSRKRIYNECKKMKDMGWTVDFLYLGSNLSGDMSAMQNFFGEEHFFWKEWLGLSFNYEIKKEWRNKLDCLGVTKWISVPYKADEWYCDDIEDGLHLICKKKEEDIESLYDIVWVQYFFSSKFLEILPGNILKVIDIHDRFSYRNRMYQKDGQVPDFYYTVPKEERLALSRADVAISIQDQEEEWFEKLLKKTGTKVVTVGDVVELSTSGFCDKRCYGFIGANNKPNELALKWFVKQVLPLVKEREPESEFVIAGGICKRIDDDDAYRKIGIVKELDDFYNSIRFSINPIRHGTGLNIKGIESLSYCKPIVSTSVGAKGLAEAKDAMVIADKPLEFAENIIELLRCEECCKKMSEAAKRFVMDYNAKNELALLTLEGLVKQKREEKRNRK